MQAATPVVRLASILHFQLSQKLNVTRIAPERAKPGEGFDAPHQVPLPPLVRDFQPVQRLIEVARVGVEKREAGGLIAPG